MSSIKFETGFLNPQEWLKESEIQLTSSKLLREIGKKKFNQFKKIKSFEDQGSSSLKYNKMKLIGEKESAYKCSLLLMGYAIELALKAGVVKFYRNIPRHLAEKNLKRGYSHKLDLMAEDLGIDLLEREIELLNLLIDFILEKARYPIVASDKDAFIIKWNENQRNLQSDTLYSEFSSLHKKIMAFTKLADRTSENPVTFGTFIIDNDGYLSFRFGGNLPTRITFKYSEDQVRNKENSIESLKELLSLNSDYHPYFNILIQNWLDIDFFEHTKKGNLQKRT